MPIVLGILGVLAGTAAPASLAAVNFFQWVTIAGNVAGMATSSQKVLAALHPVFDTILKGLANGDPGHAAVQARNWVAMNGDKAIQEYSDNAIA